MKVENNRISQIQRLISETVGKNQMRAAQQTNSKGGVDQSSFSEMAQTMSKAMSKLQDVPEVRQEKIDQIKADINSGVYKINYADLARRISLIIDQE